MKRHGYISEQECEIAKSIPLKSLLIENIIYLLRRLSGCETSPFPSLTERRQFLMTTYEELTLIVNVALLIVAILTYTHKK